MRRYEAMFLFDNAVAHDWSAVEREVRRLCERIEARLQVCVKFDERKLAYEIMRRKRGTYVLSYFDAPPNRIVELERDARLSEMVLRLLVLQSDVTEERLAELKARPADVPLQPGGDGRRSDEWRPRREGGVSPHGDERGEDATAEGESREEDRAVRRGPRGSGRFRESEGGFRAAGGEDPNG